MNWWFGHKKAERTNDSSAQVLAMAELITKLKEECKNSQDLANRYWKELQEIRKRLSAGKDIPIHLLYGHIPQNCPIDYKIVNDNTYAYIIADHNELYTISYVREFDTSKDNFNWVKKGEALLTIKYDNVGKLMGCPTTIKSPESGIFESVNNKLARKGDVLCRIRIISQDLENVTKEQLEREAIKQSVLKKERKKMIERETLDELIAEGKIFNVIHTKDGNRMAIPSDVANAVWNRDGGQCCICGSRTELEFDHIIPISKGGATTFRNLQLLCRTCNIKKSDKI